MQTYDESTATLNGKRLHPDIGCSSCPVRKKCDEQAGRRDIDTLSYGIRGGEVCLRVHTAHGPENMKE